MIVIVKWPVFIDHLAQELITLLSTWRHYLLSVAPHMTVPSKAGNVATPLGKPQTPKSNRLFAFISVGYNNITLKAVSVNAISSNTNGNRTSSITTFKILSVNMKTISYNDLPMFYLFISSYKFPEVPS